MVAAHSLFHPSTDQHYQQGQHAPNKSCCFLPPPWWLPTVSSTPAPTSTTNRGNMHQTSPVAFSLLHGGCPQSLPPQHRPALPTGATCTKQVLLLSPSSMVAAHSLFHPSTDQHYQQGQHAPNK